MQKGCFLFSGEKMNWCLTPSVCYNLRMNLKKILKNKWSIITVIVIIIAAIIFAFTRDKNTGDFVQVSAQDFVKTVAVVGTVKPADDVQLGFDNSGRVAAIYKKVGENVSVGQIIAMLSSGDVAADLDRARADLEAEQAKLNSLKSTDGTSSQTYVAKRELVQTIQKSYTDADNAIYNLVDQVYDRPRTLNAKIIFAFDDYDLRTELNDERKDTEYLLKNWRKAIENISVETYTQAQLDTTENNLYSIRNFLNRIAFAVNAFEASENLTQAQVDSYKADISLARTNINSAISELVSAKDKLRNVNSEIPFQEAKVKSAQATVRNYESQLSKSQIVAPFTGIITKQDIEVGESVSINSPVISMISISNFQIETYVPEVNIKDIKMGDTATVNLDAFGNSENFEARVIAIDPAETLKDNVSTYKVTFEFVNNDQRIKSGMTANVVITTEKREGAILLPTSTLIKKGEYSYVKVKIDKVLIEKQITVGGFDKFGNVEVLAGLSVGELVSTTPNTVK